VQTAMKAWSCSMQRGGGERVRQVEGQYAVAVERRWWVCGVWREGKVMGEGVGR
jgi:hypothetical protein